MYYSIAIDGPAGAGKSTIAKCLAQKLGWVYIDTGAMYRAVALCCLENDVDISNETKVTNQINNISINIAYINKEQHIFLNNKDVSTDIRNQEVSLAASKVAVFHSVREALVKLQQDLASKGNVIMDGRDIGTVVLPNATVKIFLTASSYERATRRYKEQLEKGIIQNFEEVLKEINHRDELDYKREISPLKKADDAYGVDTTGYSIEQIVEEILILCKKGENNSD
ncbi:MAG: cytidylate kinase [Epulopiscium sp. Nele67-Bin001]|nr:MAG: cytidylate kinase [Epulopiscium sp. Nele67-Bin001]